MLSWRLAQAAAPVLISTFPAGDGGWQLGTLAVGNLDDDPALEIVVPYRSSDGQWFLDAFKLNGQRLAGFPFHGGDRPINVSPTLFDLDGDGKQEIFFTCGNEVIALRGDGSRLWSTAVTPQTYIPNAGYQAVTNGFYWSGDRQWHATLPANAEFFSEVSPPLVVDVDGDGSLEVITAWKINPDPTGRNQDFNPFIEPLFGFGPWGLVGENWSGGVVMMDALTGRQKFVYHFHQLVESGLGLGRPDDRRPLLVYVLNDSDSVVAFDKTLPNGLFGKGMLYRQFGKNQRLMSGSYLQGVDIYPADIDGDGRAEVLAPTTQWNPLWQPNETLLDDDGAILWREWKSAADVINVNGWLNSACMIPVNPDHDNQVDVLTFSHSPILHFRTWDGVNLVERPGWPLDFSPYLPTPPVVADIDGDGEEEIIVGTYDPAKAPSDGALYLIGLDGRIKQTIPVPGGLKHIPAVADVDGDGSIDLVYRSLAGQVYVQNFGARPGASVSWATHRGNMQRDGNVGRDLFPTGAPLIREKSAGPGSVRIRWSVSEARSPDRFRIYRSSDGAAPRELILTLSPEVSEFSESGLENGRQYRYAVGAVYGGVTLLSAPIALAPTLSGEKIINGGFEENDNSHWDKWFTGDISWTNMVGTSDAPHSGRQAMEIRLRNNSSGASIKQYNQYGIPDAYIPVTPGKLYSFGGFFRSDGFSGLTSHWWEWNSTTTGQDTNARPALPWPDFFTPPLAISTNPVPWTYANRVFRMPEGFPNIEIRHRYYVERAATGAVDLDDVFFRELADVTDSRWRVLLPYGALWKFWTNNPPPSNWFDAEYDDSAWPSGRAKFGQGNIPTNIVTLLPSMLPQYEFRGEFTVDSWPLQDLLLCATCTDNFGGKIYPLELYLNGRHLVTSGIEAVTGDGNGTRYYDLTPFVDWLNQGKNSIAAVLNNGWETGWDNVAFDLQLLGLPAPAAESRPRFKSIQLQSDQSVRMEISAPVASHWLLESTEESSFQASWRELEQFVIPPLGSIVLSDGTPAWLTKARYYRIRPE